MLISSFDRFRRYFSRRRLNFLKVIGALRCADGFPFAPPWTSFRKRLVGRWRNHSIQTSRIFSPDPSLGKYPPWIESIMKVTIRCSSLSLNITIGVAILPSSTHLSVASGCNHHKKNAYFVLLTTMVSERTDVPSTLTPKWNWPPPAEEWKYFWRSVGKGFSASK